MTGPFPAKIVKPIRPLSTQYHTPALEANSEIAAPDAVALDELFSIGISWRAKMLHRLWRKYRLLWRWEDNCSERIEIEKIELDSPAAERQWQEKWVRSLYIACLTWKLVSSMVTVLSLSVKSLSESGQKLLMAMRNWFPEYWPGF